MSVMEAPAHHNGCVSALASDTVLLEEPGGGMEGCCGGKKGWKGGKFSANAYLACLMP